MNERSRVWVFRRMPAEWLPILCESLAGFIGPPLRPDVWRSQLATTRSSDL